MIYDVIIIGSGPAGIACGLYTKRAGLSTLIISKGDSALKKAHKIQNYYGIDIETSGKELYESGINQAKQLGIEIINDEVISVSKENEFVINTVNSEFLAYKIVLATGTNRNKPLIKGVQKFEGKGISYCAICDAFFFKNKDVAVLGNGNYALHEAEVLKPLVNSVTILTNGKDIIENRNYNFNVIQTPIKEFRGTETLEEIEFEDNERKRINGIFIAEGTASSSDIARKIGALIENDRIIVDENMNTTVKGLYACGDCTGGELQVTKAAFEGMKAGLDIINKIKEERGSN